MFSENKLNQKTEIIKIKAKGMQLDVIEIGKVLIEIQEKGLYKQLYSDLDRYVDAHKNEFSFGHTQARKFMTVAKQFGSLNSNTPVSGVANTLGIERLYMLTQIPDETEVSEIIGEVEDNNIPTVKELNERIKRHKTETSVDVETRTETKDKIRGLERTGNSLLNEFEDIKKTQELWKQKTTEWLATTEKYPELSPIRQDIIKRLE